MLRRYLRKTQITIWHFLNCLFFNVTLRFRSLVYIRKSRPDTGFPGTRGSVHHPLRTPAGRMITYSPSGLTVRVPVCGGGWRRPEPGARSRPLLGSGPTRAPQPLRMRPEGRPQAAGALAPAAAGADVSVMVTPTPEGLAARPARRPNLPRRLPYTDPECSPLPALRRGSASEGKKGGGEHPGPRGVLT